MLTTDIPFKIFGSVAFVHNHDTRCSKLYPKAHKCIFVGYPTNQRGYKCFDPILKKNVCLWMSLFLRTIILQQFPFLWGEH